MISLIVTPVAPIALPQKAAKPTALGTRHIVAFGHRDRPPLVDHHAAQPTRARTPRRENLLTADDVMQLREIAAHTTSGFCGWLSVSG